jgi:hypothetical protein
MAHKIQTTAPTDRYEVPESRAARGLSDLSMYPLEETPVGWSFDVVREDRGDRDFAYRVPAHVRLLATRLGYTVRTRVVEYFPGAIRCMAYYARVIRVWRVD